MSRPQAGVDYPLVEPLTPREMEVLSHLAAHRTNREIADALVVSLNTVKWHAREIYGKLGVGDRRQAVWRAKELGLLESAAPKAMRKHNLSAQLTPFLGRREALAQVIQWMKQPDSRLLTVAGPGGMGKTRLAIQAAFLMLERPEDTFRDGIYVVALASLSGAASIVSAVAEAIGFRFYQGDLEPERQLLHYLGQKRMLLVLDGFEHLIDERSLRLVIDILATAPEIRVLVTSRARLNVQGEHLLVLTGMESPDPEAVARSGFPPERALAYSGIQLFLHSAQRIRPDFELSPGNLGPITRICHSVQGMPLGIELAAAWVAVLEPDEIASEIEQSLDLLVADVGDVPERQRSLRAVFDGSWSSLAEQERLAVQRLSVFRGGFGRRGAECVGKVSVQTLFALVNKSWVQRDAGGRYQIHDLLRRYGEEKLERDSTLEAAVRDRHSYHFCTWLERHEKDITGVEQQMVIATLASDIENVLAACNWAASQGRLARLGRALTTLGLFYYRGPGGYQAGKMAFASLEAALAKARYQRPPATVRTQRVTARLWLWQSTFCALLGDLDRSDHLIRDCLALLDASPLAEQDTRPERAHIALQMGYNHLPTDREAARKHFRRCYELYRELDNEWGMASALLGWGRAARDLDALEEAQDALAHSVTLHRESGDQIGLGEALVTLGGLAVRQLRFEEGERLIREGLSLAMDTDRYGISFGLGFLGGFAQLMTGQFAAAEASLRECLAITSELGMRSYVVQWRIRLGLCCLHAGRYSEAHAQAEQVVSQARELGFDRGVGSGLALLGQVALAEGAFTQAYSCAQESLRVAEQIGSGQHEAGHMAVLGLAARGLGRHVEARQRLVAALGQARQAQQFMELMIALVGTILLLADEGELERAVELYALASRYPFVGHSRWFRDVAAEPLARPPLHCRRS